jgi:hypothetical protein
MRLKGACLVLLELCSFYIQKYTRPTKKKGTKKKKKNEEEKNIKRGSAEHE